MGNFVYIVLDTTAPSNPTLQISGGAIYSTNQLVDLTISVGDGDTTGYQMLIFGDVDETYNVSIQSTEGTSGWIPYSVNPQVKLSSSDGAKTISLRVRDDVHNPSSIVVANITMDTSIPTVTATGTDVPKISKIVGKDTVSFTFSSNEDFLEYKVKLVGTIGATQETGTLIPTTNGSINTSGTGSFTSSTVTTVTLKGKDLELAGATTDGQLVIKVFVKDDSNHWSA
jgi:hypothetical protein